MSKRSSKKVAPKVRSVIKLAADYFKIQANALKEEYFVKGKWTDKDAEQDHEVHMIMMDELEELERSESYSLKTRRKKVYMYKCDKCTAWFSTDKKMKCTCGNCDPEDDDVIFPCHECEDGKIQLSCISFDTRCRIIKAQEEEETFNNVDSSKIIVH